MQIPKQHAAGLAALARLSDPVAAEFRASLAQKDTLVPDITGSASRIADKIGVPGDEVKLILRAVVSLSGLRAESGENVPEFLEKLGEAITESGHLPLRALSDVERQQLKANLARLLSFEPFIMASKAIYLRQDYERTYCLARIFTDIRPIFGDDRTAKPLASILVHMLKLKYHKASDLKEIHIALDTADLAALKSAIERAEQKAKSLESFLKDAKVPAFMEPPKDGSH
ncbi:MAG: hypothetical protein ABSC63_02450 [Candidatus Binataceae bacterium]